MDLFLRFLQTCSNRLCLAVFFVFTLAYTQVSGQNDIKKPLDFNVYDGWKSVAASSTARNGELVTYEINPQEGDGELFIYSVAARKNVWVQPRGRKAQIAADGSFVVFSIAHPADSLRKLKLKKVKPDKMPKDSLGVFVDGQVVKYASVKAFKIPAESGRWVAVHFDKSLAAKPDSAGKNKKKKFKSEGSPLLFLNPTNKDSLRLENVVHFEVAPSGSSAYLIQSVGDTLEKSLLLGFNPSDFSVDTLMKASGSMQQLVVSKDGARCAFVYSADTVKHRAYSLYYYDTALNAPLEILPVDNQWYSNGWCASANGKNWFSDDGSRLFFGVAPKPVAEPRDSLTDDEKVHLDVWTWQDKDIQPKQKARLKQERERTWLACFDVVRKTIVPLANEEISRVEPLNKGNSPFALGYEDGPYKHSSDWLGHRASNIYKIDLNNGSSKLLVKNHASDVALSPDGKYLVYYQPGDSAYFVMDTQDGSVRNLTRETGVPFHNELNDVPDLPGSYRIVGWTREAGQVLINDRFDVWLFSLNQKRAHRLTNGRETLNRYRYLNLDRDQLFIDLKAPAWFSVFNETTKQSGISVLKNKKLKLVLLGDYHLLTPIKAKNSNTFLIQRSTFNQAPELELTNSDFSDFTKLTDLGRQQEPYLWGNIRMVKWNTPQGKTLDGLLITPENLDPDKKYPMVVYFYERSSDRLHSYPVPRPSRSTINWAFYASNGYVVFVPDITYSTGNPGADAYDAVVSGAQAMVKEFSFIDADRMALQGQSWGGYQIAWLVTQTNLFRCAMAGAPVSNMTSAYGGIRWQTGMSRMFQYEKTQSRIGGTLWDKTRNYIENSPVFYAPNVQTPLLMMHNDNDGAVPWYQGIEYFMALRRLNKHVWMLVYNNEEHNLTRRANSKDLSKRMMQFFNHYLKGEPMPVWMKEGIPAIDKGKKMGYELSAD